MKPLISIIVPIYNSQKLLSRCLDSLINQTIEDIEIILINDGSTDNSSQICDQYAKRDQRIKVIHQQNGGQANARNQGIAKATGEYLGFCDCDDWVDNQMFEQLYQQANSSQAEIVACNFWRITPSKRYLQYQGKQQVIEYSKTQAMTEIFNNSILTFSIWNKIYKRELFDNIKFPEGIIFEDIDVSYRLIHATNKVIYLNKPFYHYEYHKASTIRGGFDLKHLDELKVRQKMYEFYQQYYPQLSEIVYFQIFWHTIINYTLIRVWYKKELSHYKQLLSFDRPLLCKLVRNRKMTLNKRTKVLSCLLLPGYGTFLMSMGYRMKRVLNL